ncbi:hypothetical protein [Desmonostoc muscorum]|nr:hypothetical protein [Desmonostoc muscorum]
MVAGLTLCCTKPIDSSSFTFIPIDMVILKPKQLSWVMFFLLGIGYFNVMSHLEIDNFWKSLIVLMPMQVAAIIYVTYSRIQNSESRIGK